MSFNNLPGVQVSTVDGGLVARRVPRTKKTLIVGTSGKGPADDTYQVLDRALAAQTFGLDGTLVRAMEEVASGGCDNIVLFRMGTKAMKLANIGLEFAAGVAISNVVLTSNVVTVTANAHGYAVGDVVKVAAVTNTPINGTFTVTAVTTNTFSYNLTHANIPTGADTGNAYKRTSPGFSISFGEVTSDAASRYKIWYAAGVVYVWLDGNLVYANDSVNDTVVDIGDLVIDGTVSGNVGLTIGTGGSGALSGAITITAAAALSGTTVDPTPVLTSPVTGLGMTGRQTYIALLKAFELLDNFPVDQVYCPNALADQPNVAYYVVTDNTTLVNNPVSNADALDWLKVSTDADGNKTYQWAKDTVDDQGNTVAAMGVVADAAARLAAGFYEVSFPYAIANFCQKQEENLGACAGFIGTNGPDTFKLADVRSWVGHLPTYSLTNSGKAITPGKGLLGIPFLVGTTAAKLNSLTADYAGGYRVIGYFKTAEEQLDGTTELDKNGNRIDIGAYLHVVADMPIMSNGFRLNYAANMAGLVAGLCSALDEKSALTNKPVNAIQLWRGSLTQLDQLTQASINVLRFKNDGELPVLLHGQTAASAISDYKNLLRQRIKGLVVRTVRTEADKFIGESTIDGLQMQALQTALEAKFLTLQKRGYLSKFSFAVFTTEADQRIGHASIDITFNPADELVQLKANVGVSRR